MLVILLFIIILNIVSIVLMYYCLADLTKKEKLIYIAAGTALMYILTTIVYWISTRGIEMTEVSEMGKKSNYIPICADKWNNNFATICEVVL